ncbi:MAG: AAA family ATPase, partial [Actinomycetota bacterium]|nr:AAA family ATPase [Actinomycetota bacterium]
QAFQRGDVRPVPVPWDALTSRLVGGGLPPRSCTVLVGTTGSGKTQFCVQIGVHAAQQGTPVLYVALEADQAELVARCATVLNPDLYWSSILLGKQTLPQADIDRLAALPFHATFPEPRRFSADRLTEHVGDVTAAYPGATPLVVVDFLQLVGANDGDRKDLRERVGDVAYAARDLARQTGCAMLLVSSTARENLATLTGDGGSKTEASRERQARAGRGDPFRLVGLGKETGDIENSATAVLVLGRDSYTAHGPTEMFLAIAKQRAGTGAWVDFLFDGRTFVESTTQRLDDTEPGEAVTIARPTRKR